MRPKNSRLILLIGYIGAGKSTYSQQLWQESPQTTLRVCMDEIIQMASFYDYQPNLRSFYRGEEAHMILRGLALGLDVIVDRTNLEAQTRAVYIRMGQTVRSIAQHLLEDLASPDLFGVSRPLHLERRIVELTQNLDDGMLYQQAFLYAYQQYAWSSSPTLFSSPMPRTYRELLNRVAHLRIIGVHFDVPPEVCLQRRISAEDRFLRERVRTIDWREVLEKMIRRFEPPSLDEGFDELWVLDERFERKEHHTAPSPAHR